MQRELNPKYSLTAVGDQSKVIRRKRDKRILEEIADKEKTIRRYQGGFLTYKYIMQKYNKKQRVI